MGGFGFGRVGSGSAEVKNYPKLISSNLKWPIYAAPKQLKNAMLWLIWSWLLFCFEVEIDDNLQDKKGYIIQM